MSHTLSQVGGETLGGCPTNQTTLVPHLRGGFWSSSLNWGPRELLLSPKPQITPGQIREFLSFLYLHPTLPWARICISLPPPAAAPPPHTSLGAWKSSLELFFFIYFQGIRVLLDILLTSCNRFAGARWQQMASHTRDVKITGWVYSRRFIRDGICKGAALCSHQPCISTTELSSGELINPECPAVESSSSKPSFMPL